MRVLAWNVQGAVPPFGSKDRIRQQLEYIDERAELPDLLLLNEVTTVQRDLWREGLRDLGYTEIADTLDWAAELRESEIPPHQDYGHVNGNLTAVHDHAEAENLERQSPSIRYGPWKNSDLKDWDTNVPEKILNTSLDIGGEHIDIWNIRAIPGSMHGEEKIKIFENVYNRIEKAEPSLRILAGDLNSPDEELADGTVVPWRVDQEGDLAERWVAAERSLLEGLQEFGMVDVFRHLNGFGDLDVLDVSHATRTDDPLSVSAADVRGKRFDHLFASGELDPMECHYDQQGFACSDHAPILAEFDPL